MARLHIPALRMMGILATALLLLGACGGDDGDAPTTGSDGDDETVTLNVTTVDNSFDPSSLSAPAGGEVTVDVSNDGSNPHTFTIDDLEVDTDTIDPGGSASATFTMPDSSVTFYCEIHGEDAMSGTIETS